MELTERLAYLESVRDWQQLREELEEANQQNEVERAEGAAAPAARASARGAGSCSASRR